MRPCIPKRRNSRLAHHGIATLLLFFVLLLLAGALIYNLQVLPALLPLAKANCTTALTDTVQRIVQARMRSDGNGYADYVRLCFAADGTVASVETNTPRLSALAGEVVQDTANALTQDRMTIHIPLGSLSGNALFSGKGPDVQIKLAISEKITCTVHGDFAESGINQTLHRVFLRITVEVTALLPGTVQTFSVPTDVCVAETVIVGKVPEAYTRIDRSAAIDAAELNDLADYSAKQ